MTTATRYDRKLDSLGYRLVQPSRRRLPDEAAVRRAETRIGASLPGDYREFLLKYGLCALGSEGYVECEIEEECPWGGLVTSVFYGFIDPEDSYDLEGAYETFRGRMPPNLVPIGMDPGGNQVCISVSGDDHGSVYFWDHEHRELGGFERLEAMYRDLEEDGIETTRLGIDQAIFEWEKRHPEALKKPPGYSNVYLIARSFEDFIDMLELRPYDGE
jgi:hypothetical protein